MRLLKRLLLFIIGLLLVIVLAFWGFKENFPGKSIANAIQLRLTTQTGIPVEIEALELSWLKVSTPEIALRTPRWLAATPDVRLLIIKNVEALFVPLITSGKAKILGQLHGGTIEVYTDLRSRKMFDITLTGVKIEQVPLIAALPYAFVSGRLSLSSQIENINALQSQQAQFPEGNLQGRLIDAEIRISGGGYLLGIQLPDLDFSEVLFDLQLGPLIAVRKIQIKGSFDGMIEGTIRLNEKRPRMSLIDLNIELTPSPALKDEISNFGTLLRSFQCGETIKVNLKGTLNRINFPTRNKC
ncbi:MAG: type II secretion system protein GspN [Proteobacteria bacterium]|jgi:type II secretion system protein N|nr:type II secretion system protein GspN [Pseudomonadota bacterium]MBT5793499.1 type II secretion system protein GspN [Deltaproteobacteria bacterium]